MTINLNILRVKKLGLTPHKQTVLNISLQAKEFSIVVYNFSYSLMKGNTQNWICQFLSEWINIF